MALYVTRRDEVRIGRGLPSVPGLRLRSIMGRTGHQATFPRVCFDVHRIWLTDKTLNRSGQTLCNSITYDSSGFVNITDWRSMINVSWERERERERERDPSGRSVTAILKLCFHFWLTTCILSLHAFVWHFSYQLKIHLQRLGTVTLGNINNNNARVILQFLNPSFEC